MATLSWSDLLQHYHSRPKLFQHHDDSYKGCKDCISDTRAQEYGEMPERPQICQCPFLNIKLDIINWLSRWYPRIAFGDCYLAFDTRSFHVEVRTISPDTGTLEVLFLDLLRLDSR